MRIAVIGAGNIGGTIGSKWEKAGHEVIHGLRDPAKKRGAKPTGDALKGAEAVLLAIPGSDVVPFVKENTKDLDGKIIMDATNNFRASSLNSWTELSALVPKAHLYRAFNSLGWDVFANPTLGGAQADLFFAGPDGNNRAVVEKLISDVGMRPIWVGGPDQVGTIDGVLRLWYTLSGLRGRRIAFKLISD